jgi:exopolysaccharide biosynthesis polyprenyl glycosylphosphotransferase
METKFRWDGRIAKTIELLVDLFLVILGFGVVIQVGGQMDIDYRTLNFYEIRDLLVTNLTYVVVTVIFFRVYNTSVLNKGYVNTLVSVFFSLMLTNIVLVFILFLIPNLSYTRVVLIATVFTQFVFIAIWKAIVVRFIRRRNIKSALIFGLKDEVQEITKKLLLESSSVVNIKYIIIQEDKNYREVLDRINDVDQIYITPGCSERAKNRVINDCLGKRGIDVFLVPKTFEISLYRSTPHSLKDILTLQISSFHLSLEELLIKRGFDFLVSLIGIIVLSPLLIVIAIIIRTYDNGPVFFRQERVTMDNKRFMIYKFRSMIDNAEKDTGAVQASENDNRITPIGKFIRATRIDELPQLFNVLKGEMSLVGPRALRTEEIEDFEEQNRNFKFRAHVKAGMTGLAQTQGNYATTRDDKLRLDLLYIRNFSFWNDLKIILYTVKVVFDRDSSKGVSEDSTCKEYLEAYGYSYTELDENNIITTTKAVK